MHERAADQRAAGAAAAFRVARRHLAMTRRIVPPTKLESRRCRREAAPQALWLVALLLLGACASARPRVVVQPRTVADFDDPRKLELVEVREVCPWQTRGHAAFAVVADAGGPQGSGVLRLDYEFDAGEPTPVGIELALDAVDLSPYDHLVFRARIVGEEIDEPAPLRVGFRRKPAPESTHTETGSSFVDDLAPEWSTVAMPLDSMLGLQGRSNVTALLVLVEPRPGVPLSGSIEVDDFVLLRVGRRGPSADDRPLTPRKRMWVNQNGGPVRSMRAIAQRAVALPTRVAVPVEELPTDDLGLLRRLAHDSWRGLDSLRDRASGLPFDTVSFEDEDDADELRIGDYTNVTNVGLYLTALVGAYEMGLIDRAGALERAERVLQTLRRLETHGGFFFNYYDTTSLERSSNFISFVDSAWLATGLIVLRAALPELSADASDILDRGDFGFFYDAARGLMSHGFYTHLGRSSEYHYGILYTEARLGSLLAIGKGDVPPLHWLRLLRVLPPACSWQSQSPRFLPPQSIQGEAVLQGFYEWSGIPFVPSWGGSMFEALMPLLVLDEMRWAPDSFGANAHAHVAIQQAWNPSNADDPLWGRSPCRRPDGLYEEFGVPALGVKGYPDAVIAPYASALALAVNPDAASIHLRRLASIEGLYGEFGFFDGYDPANGTIARAYLALDQAMTVIALANHLQQGAVRRHFESDPIVREALPLLTSDQFFSPAPH